MTQNLIGGRWACICSRETYSRFIEFTNIHRLRCKLVAAFYTVRKQIRRNRLRPMSYYASHLSPDFPTMATPSKSRIVKKSEKEAQLEREVAELRRQLKSAGAHPNGITPGGAESSYSHTVYGTLIELFPQAVWMTDAQGQNIYSNRFWHEFSGMTFDQTAGSGWISAVHPEDIARGQWTAAVARGETFENEV